ncbi:ribbon-helix-helix protein, CopG family [bacterium]|nr:ribbon-helix-helix protein, CopG family [bacterium]
MKTAISIPDTLFEAADRLARRLGVSRSELYQRAIARYLEHQGDEAVTAALDRVHARSEDRGLDPVLDALQRASLARDEW